MIFLIFLFLNVTVGANAEDLLGDFDVLSVDTLLLVLSDNCLTSRLEDRHQGVEVTRLRERALVLEALGLTL